MPQQFFTNDYGAMYAPMQRAISSATQNLGGAVQSGMQAHDQNVTRQRNAAANSQDFQVIQNFFSPIEGLNVDWDSLQPRPDEPNEQYRTRLKSEAMPIMDQLDRMGFDPREISTATKIPGVTMEFMGKLRDKRITRDVGRQISGGYGQEAYDAVMAGQMSLADINSKYGTNMTQADYERVAGLQAPGAQPMKPNPAAMAGPIQGPAMVPDMDAVRAGAAAQKPMDFPTAAAQTPITRPMQYDQAVRKITESDLSSGARESFTPILNTMASKAAAESARQPDQNEVGLYTDVAGQGMGVDETAKAIGGAMRAGETLEWQKKKQEDLLAYKNKYNQMRQKEQDVSLLKLLLQDAWKRGDFAQAYGKEAETAAKAFFDREKELADIDRELDVAFSWDSQPYEYTKNKASPDVSSLMMKRQAIQDELIRLRQVIPENQIRSDNYRQDPTRVRRPDAAPNAQAPGVNRPEKKRKPLSTFDR